MNCTRCQGTGFLNIEQVPQEIQGKSPDEILAWVKGWNEPNDISVCDCCGDGEGAWYGVPGEHYSADDPRGSEGPYAYNGGLCECH